jgi:hypothetical protein
VGTPQKGDVDHKNRAAGGGRDRQELIRKNHLSWCKGWRCAIAIRFQYSAFPRQA